MNKYVENLKSFLAEQSRGFKYDDTNSILEVLYHYYSEANPIDSAVIRCQFKELDDVLCHLSLVENNAVFSTTCNLCASYEKQAFLDGVSVGLQLSAALEDLEK